KQQTSALVRNLFENHLVALQIHHDNSAKSSAIFDFFAQKNSENLDFFFLSIDQADPSHTPEFRFLTDASGVIWDDGNGHFYGVNEV
ncbi:ATPase, partial [Vibrio parahaemolyticus]|nr:ATPase [Vibrio parahaemolyticus]